MGIKVGDLVMIRKECTIEELMANKWNKAHQDTLAFLGGAELDEVYEVVSISKRGNAVIKTEDGEDLYVNYNLLEVVEQADDEDDDEEPVEMTIDEIQVELGCKIKIVG